MALDGNVEVCIVNIVSLILIMTIHLTQKAQSIMLMAKEITFLSKYIDYANVFLKKLAKV